MWLVIKKGGHLYRQLLGALRLEKPGRWEASAGEKRGNRHTGTGVGSLSGNSCWGLGSRSVGWTHLEIKRGWRWRVQYGTYPDTNGSPGTVRSIPRGIWMASYSPCVNRYYSDPRKERRGRHIFVCIFTNMREKPRALGDTYGWAALHHDWMEQCNHLWMTGSEAK